MFIEEQRAPELIPQPEEELVPADDLCHFALEVVEEVDVRKFKCRPGVGRPGYRPAMLLGLLLYSYSRGYTSSRSIERQCREHIPTRYLTGKLCPDHDTICAFRKDNVEAIREAFLVLVDRATKQGLLRGTVSVDGTHMKANASLRRNVSLKRVRELIADLGGEIGSLLERAEEDSGVALTHKVQDFERLRRNLCNLEAHLEKAKAEKDERRRQEYESKREQWEARGGRGRCPKEPEDVAEVSVRGNLTDSDSQALRKGNSSGLQQCYNAQATVDAHSQVICGARVAESTDMGELAANVACSEVPVDVVLADAGYAKEEDVAAVEAQGVEALVAVKGAGRRKFDFREEPVQKPSRRMPEWARQMQERVERKKEVYKLRAQSVETVFGIIKNVMGIRGFRLRGRVGVRLEWLLIATAFNLRRLNKLLTSACGPGACLTTPHL